MNALVLGVFSNHTDADSAIEDLRLAGFDTKEISLIVKDTTENGMRAKGATITAGTTQGVVTGGVIGGIAGLLIGMGAIALPGIGAILIGGPLAATLGLTGAAATTVSGAVTGALAGGIVGALTGLGLPEEEARLYEDRIKEGAVLIAVPSKEDRGEEIRGVLEQNDADQIRFIQTK